MKGTGRDPRALNVPALCRAGDVLEGHWPLTDLRRLAESFAGVAHADGLVQWSASGSQEAVGGGEAQLWLTLHAAASVPLQCQRCLQALVQPLTVDRRIRFVHDEDEAARLDEDSEDDVLALPQRLDLPALIEDELILALPLVPRHDVCPEPLLAATSDELPGSAEPVAPHPFAALAALRDKGRT